MQTYGLNVNAYKAGTFLAVDILILSFTSHQKVKAFFFTLKEMTNTENALDS